jgi:hypothetical protein
MELTGPKSLKIEHDHLHDDLSSAIAKGGRTGEAARMVATRLHPHFLHEEEFAIPPLGLLAALSQDESSVPPELARKAVTLTDRLASELPHMLAEHREIVDALASLVAAAKEEGNHEVAHFAEKLMLHAQTEEEVLYPAAIILGRYLKLKAAMPEG